MPVFLIMMWIILILSVLLIQFSTISSFDYDIDCSSTGPDQMFEHPYYCSKYLICLEYELTEISCPDGMHFSSNAGDCIDGECEDPETSFTTDQKVDTYLLEIFYEIS